MNTEYLGFLTELLIDNKATLLDLLEYLTGTNMDVYNKIINNIKKDMYHYKNKKSQKGGAMSLIGFGISVYGFLDGIQKELRDSTELGFLMTLGARIDVAIKNGNVPFSHENTDLNNDTLQSKFIAEKEEEIDILNKRINHLKAKSRNTVGEKKKCYKSYEWKYHKYPRESDRESDGFYYKDPVDHNVHTYLTAFNNPKPKVFMEGDLINTRRDADGDGVLDIERCDSDNNWKNIPTEEMHKYEGIEFINNKPLLKCKDGDKYYKNYSSYKPRNEDDWQLCYDGKYIKDPFKRGDKVVIHGLENNVALNGMTGKIVKSQNKEKIAKIKLDKGGEEKALKWKNLAFMCSS